MACARWRAWASMSREVRVFRLHTEAMLRTFGWTSRFRLTVRALRTGTPPIDHVVQGTVPIEGDAHQVACFPVEILDTPLFFEELWMVTALAIRCGEEQGTAKALSAIARGMGIQVGRMHTHPFPATGDSIRVTIGLRVTVLIEWHGCDAEAMDDGLVDIPRIIGCIGGDVLSP
jgi:hypothetical protein